MEVAVNGFPGPTEVTIITNENIQQPAVVSYFCRLVLISVPDMINNTNNDMCRYFWDSRALCIRVSMIFTQHTEKCYLQPIHFRVHKPALMMAATPFGLLTRRNNASVGTAKIGLI